MLSQKQPFKFILKLLQISGIDYKDLSLKRRVLAFYLLAQYSCFMFLVVLQGFLDLQQAAMMEKLAVGIVVLIIMFRGAVLCFRFGKVRALLNQIDDIFDGHESFLKKALKSSTMLAKIQFGFVFMSMFMLALKMLITREFSLHPYEFQFIRESAIKFPIYYLQYVMNVTYNMIILNAIDFLPTFIMMTFPAYLEFLNEKFTRITFSKCQRNNVSFIEAIELYNQFKRLI